MGINTAVTTEAEQYLVKMQVKFQSYKRDWEKFPDEVFAKSKEILLNGIAPEVSGGYGSNGFSYNVNIDLDKNKPALEKYISTLKDQLQGKAEKFHSMIREFDEKLEYFRKNDLEEVLMEKLVRHFVQWVDYAKVLKFQYGEAKHEIELPETYLTQKQKWLNRLPAAASKTSVSKPSPAQSQSAQEQKPVADPAQEVRDKRNAETEKIKKALEAEYTEGLSSLKRQNEEKLKKLHTEKAEAEKALAEKKTYLSTLGFFQFGEKKSAKSEIATLQQATERLQQDIEELADTFERNQEALKKRVEQKWERQRQEIRRKIPTPRGISLFDIVLLGMDPGRKYTIQELAELPDVPEEITLYLLNNRIVSPLVAQHKLRRITENNRTYYVLP